MSGLLRAVHDFHQTVEALPRFADAMTQQLPSDARFAGDWSNVLLGCRKTRRHSLILACLLIGKHNGLLSTDELNELNRLALGFGLYEAALEGCRTLLRQADEKGAAIDLLILTAKAQRGLGRYSEAQAIYRDLLSSTSDELLRIRLLLNLAKVAHTSSWRTGYYQAMCAVLVARLARSLESTPDDRVAQLRYWLGVCLDSVAKVDLERSQGQSYPPLSADGDRKSAFAALDESIRIAEQDGPHSSLQRRMLRSRHFRFSIAKSRSERLEHLREFEEVLAELGTENDPRGIGVRYGQLGEMQCALGFFDEAQHSIRHAIGFSKRVSDRRALARNHMRAARLAVATGRPFSEFEQQVDLARDAVAHLELQHPELEIEIDRELSVQLRDKGRLVQSHAALRRVTEVLDRLERRVLSDFHLHTQGPETFAPAERAVVSSEEWARLTTSLVVDYQFVSSNLRETLEQMTLLAKRDARQEGIDAQLWLLGDYMSSVEHRSANVLKALSGEGILGVFRAASRHSQSEPMTHAVGMLERELQRITDLQREALHNASIIASSDSQFVSMRVTASTLDVDLERSIDRRLRIELPTEGSASDFRLLTHEPVLRQALTHLLENAAHMVLQAVPEERLIAVRTFSKRTEEGHFWGVLEIEDSAGRASELERALQRIVDLEALAAPAARISGLFLAHRYFSAFQARWRVELVEGSRTRLTIEFPHDDRYVQVG